MSWLWNGMKELLELTKEFSVAAILVTALVAAGIFVLRNGVEKAIDDAFDRRSAALALELERRSRFEEMILIERYQTISELLNKVGRITTELNRRRNGEQIDGLMKGREIVPLTDIYELLAAKRHVVTERFYPLIAELCNSVLALANASDSSDYDSLVQRYVQRLHEIQSEMDLAFGLSKINWHRSSEAVSRLK